MASFNAQAEQHRNQKAKSIFKYSHPCPSTGGIKGSCPDYIIDHVKPLACGGLDDASNMQWQTKAEAKAKDKWERKNCAN
ncbi:MAG: HNH endonuclease [Betaproteobacteria bacterium HGW-Betaproteobacteria-20]|nr:MAG: HNH endonuclease [Betaproteobacteria bacterium HGW-Betaproteobacteria-20]